MTRTIAALGLLLLLAGCGCQDNAPFDEMGSVTEITMYGSHSYEDCGAKRGCRREYVPDRWYINFRADAGHDHTFNIDHPPWEWQLAGKRIRVRWVPSCFVGTTSWHWTRFEPGE